MRMSYSSPGRGLTLLELLLVVAILAVLLSILAPAIFAARAAARRVECASNLRQYACASDLYRGDYDGLVPLSPAAEFQPPPEPVYLTYFQVFGRYMDLPIHEPDPATGHYARRGVLYCPADTEQPRLSPHGYAYRPGFRIMGAVDPETPEMVQRRQTIDIDAQLHANVMHEEFGYWHRQPACGGAFVAAGGLRRWPCGLGRRSAALARLWWRGRIDLLSLALGEECARGLAPLCSSR